MLILAVNCRSLAVVTDYQKPIYLTPVVAKNYRVTQLLGRRGLAGSRNILYTCKILYSYSAEFGLPGLQYSWEKTRQVMNTS